MDPVLVDGRPGPATTSVSPGAPRRAPGGDHAVEALLLGIRAVGQGGEVARPAAGGRRRRDRHGTTIASGARRRRLGQAALAPRHEQRRGGEPAALDGPLPDAVARGAVARGGGVEADRARLAATAARPWWSSRGARAARCSRSAAARRAGRRRPGEVDPRQRAPLAPRGTRRDGDRGARAAHRAGELRVGLAQPDGPAEGDEEDVDGGHGPPFCPAVLGTLINVGTVLAGTAIGVSVGRGCRSASSSACWPGSA